jgi:peptidoglycan-associated lipoprotein
MKSAIATFLLCLCCAAVSGAQTIQISASYLNQGTQSVGGASSVGFNGGRADIAYGFPHRLSMVGEYTGAHSYLGSSTYDLTLLTYMFGPRLTLSLANPSDKTGCAAKDAIGRPKCFNMFFQFLVGGAHASDGAFPQNGTFVSSANSIAISGGGGMEVTVSPRASLRLFQVDYLTTALPNQYGTHQNYYRVGAGLVLRLR